MKRISTVAFLVLIAFAGGTQAYERFPIWAVGLSGIPQTGATIKAATAGSSPPTYVGSPATEVGNGAYYFKLGSGGGEIPPGYYDVYVNGDLSADWTNIYLGLGNIPPANSITSAMIQNGAIDLSQDVKTSYGTGTANVGQVLPVHVNTKNSTPGAEDYLYLWVENQATGTAAVAERTLVVSYQTDMSDGTGGDCSGAFSALMQSNNSYTLQPRQTTQGPMALDVRALFTTRGYGLTVDTRNKGTSWAPHAYWPFTAGGIANYTAVDGASFVAGIESRLDAKNITYQAHGAYGEVYGGNTVPQAYGGYFASHGDGSTYAPNAYGTYGVAEGGANAYGSYGKAIATDGATHYGAYGYATGWGVTPGYGVYGTAGPYKTDYAGYFDGRVAADSAMFPPDAPAPATSWITTVRSGPLADYGVPYYAGLGAKSNCLGLWIDGGNVGKGNTGIYLTNGAYGIWQENSTGVNQLTGQTTLFDVTAKSLTLSNAVNGGEATIAANADTVRVTTAQVTAEASNIINVTPVAREVEGGTWWVVVRSGSFTIHTHGNQSATQSFYWTVAKR